MKKEKIQRFHWIYSIVSGIICVVAGICLIAGCLMVYYSGSEQPYSRESVAAAFEQIKIPVYLCAAAVAGGFLLELLFPSSPNKSKPQKDLPHILSRLKAKADLSGCKGLIQGQIAKLESRRKLHKLCLACVIAVCTAAFLIYALNINHFHPTRINDSMILAMRVLLPCLALSFGYGIFVSFYEAACIQKEIALYRQIPAAKGSGDTAGDTTHSGKYLRLAISAVAVSLIVYGLFTGGTLDVLTKAVNICTECIGLG